MKKVFFKNRLISGILVALLIVFIVVPIRSVAAQAPVNLGSTATFAVLAYTTITNTGTTTINGSTGGDVGLFPGTEFTGQESITIAGSLHIADAVASLAQTDLITAYDDANGRLPVTRIPSELGGTTLTPGIYDWPTEHFKLLVLLF